MANNCELSLSVMSIVQSSLMTMLRSFRQGQDEARVVETLAGLDFTIHVSLEPFENGLTADAMVDEEFADITEAEFWLGAPLWSIH